MRTYERLLLGCIVELERKLLLHDGTIVAMVESRT